MMNLYMQGIYAPVHNEIVATELTAIGDIPRDLHGVFVSNSPNPRFAAPGRHHWFDGDGMLHSVSFEGGVASYRNRWVRTQAFVAESEAGRALWGGLYQPNLQHPISVFKDTANTDVVFHAGRLLALWWLSGDPYIIRLSDLTTCGIENFGGQFKAMAAHPKIDPHTGELMFIHHSPSVPYLIYGVASADGQLMHSVKVNLPGPRLQHDIAITKRYTIFLDMPAMTMERLASPVVADCAVPSRFGLLPRYGAAHEIRWFEATPWSMYHTVNAWEEGDKVVILGCKTLPSHESSSGVNFANLRIAPVLCRWTIDLNSGRVREEDLDDLLTEFPRIDERRRGQPSRYSYHQRLRKGPTGLFDAIIKYETDKGTSRTHPYPAGCYGGETAFAPRAGTEHKAEDDGYLLVFVTNEATMESELHVLDARHIEAPPVSCIKLPQRVPIGFHTCWVPLS